MSGHFGPITCCDRDCAEVNGCSMGGLQCEDCGKWYCGYEVEEYLGMTLCGDCADSWRRRHN